MESKTTNTATNRATKAATFMAHDTMTQEVIMSTHLTASPMKLRDGSWGAKVQGYVRNGDAVTVRTKAGKSWTSSVSKVVWQGDGICIVATAAKKKSQHCYVGGRKYKRERGYCYYPCPVTGLVCSPENGRCHDCI